MKIQINESGLINNLSSVFSNHMKVYSEMIQNARRAKSDRVELFLTIDGKVLDLPDITLSRISDYELKKKLNELNPDNALIDLTVKDYGCGIDDISILLNVAASDWQADTQENENPYGMGALAMLFACPEITVKSKGKHCFIDTTDAIQGVVIPDPIDDNSFTTGTEITLHALATSLTPVVMDLLNLARTSSLPISLNGQALARDYAMDYLIAQDYEQHEIKEGTLLINPDSFAQEPAIILQDLPLTDGKKPWNASVFLFCNNTVKGRMPDRDCLLDGEVQHQNILRSIREVHSTRLIERRENID